MGTFATMELAHYAHAIAPFLEFKDFKRLRLVSKSLNYTCMGEASLEGLEIVKRRLKMTDPDLSNITLKGPVTIQVKEASTLSGIVQDLTARFIRKIDLKPEGWMGRR